MKVEWNTEQSPWEELSDMKEDCLQMTAQHLVDAEATARSQQGHPTQAWAKKTLRDISQTAWRMAELCDLHRNTVTLLAKMPSDSKHQEHCCFESGCSAAVPSSNSHPGKSPTIAASDDNEGLQLLHPSIIVDINAVIPMEQQRGGMACKIISTEIAG
jgi:hypothetical protein